jgi:hypothetical protein
MFAILSSIGTTAAIDLFTTGFMLGISAYAATKETKSKK